MASFQLFDALIIKFKFKPKNLNGDVATLNTCHVSKHLIRLSRDPS